MHRREVLALTGTVLTAGLAGCSAGDGGGTTSTATPEPTATETETSTETATETSEETPTETELRPSLEVRQMSSTDGTIVIPRAEIDGTGWLVVHPEAAGGGPNGGVVLAQQMLEPGSYTDIGLQLSEYVAGEQTVYAMLHYDDPADGEFTFPQNGDPPVTSDGSPVVEPLTYRMTGSFDPALEVTDQATAGASVTVSRATIDQTGWLVVHPEADDGGPDGGVVLARRMLEPGTYADVTLELSDPVGASQTLYAMLHYDDPADGEFTFPQDGDPPVTSDGSPVVVPFSLTVEGETTTAASMDGETTTVEMANTAYTPLRVSVEPGATVEWVNRDTYGHDVVSAAFHDSAAEWDLRSRTVGQGETVTYTFEETGIYEYYCSVHGRNTMCGAVLVGDVSLDQQLPCEM